MLYAWPWEGILVTFKRPHHQLIAEVLSDLNGSVLRAHNCLFGGGTVIALRYGEYRESVDIDFLVSDLASYGDLRQLLTGASGIASLLRNDATALVRSSDIRGDRYGIRTKLLINDLQIKFEIVLEGRVVLEPPTAADLVCGISTLTPLDMATSKLLANSDHWNDDGIFNRDIIDLAMMKPALPLLRAAVQKAETAYGQAIRRDIDAVLQRLQNRRDWLDRCMLAMAMDLPKAELWQRLRALRRILP